MTDFFRINDTIMGWQSSRFIIGVQPYIGIKSFDFSDTIDAPFVWAGRRDGKPVGTVEGKYIPGDAKLVMLRDTADDAMTMWAALAALNGDPTGSIGRARFPITYQASELIPSGVGLPTQTALLDTCRVIGIHEAQDEGTGELVTEFTIRTLGITRNGKVLWSRARELL